MRSFLAALTHLLATSSGRDFASPPIRGLECQRTVVFTQIQEGSLHPYVPPEKKGSGRYLGWASKGFLIYSGWSVCDRFQRYSITSCSKKYLRPDFSTYSRPPRTQPLS
jgi:hypothetical protein